ncbi:unnamed protein product [Schistosoma guineensis]|uniref:PDZ and LIM domain protein 1 n=3 Tax=Schistosoma TaxID=6181 RepID=A0A094ZJT1_SCHHA|nr:PDZ and LIM domain protein 1 [Schistosoma haematobium]CAH8607802.1 unnamed protein product [Schistosoma mattheei]CAH8616175.1 unnamed protein product [Schistosoma intercalatum]CAH8628970.1 unnamed protein product [Schistosoma guineensis]CAH8634810.1 unnamed protein product [Schistosoma curassoni]KAH9590057.1 PDZ and LIM domain protein 1 [Schistosoma haematobium]
MASQHCSIRLIRQDTSIPWGFRLEGGTDFGHSITIQHVNPGSIADYSGLRAGDHVIRINQSETKWMRHDDAKMEIIRSSNDLELFVQRNEIVNQYTHQNNFSPSPKHSLSRSPKPVSPQPVSRQTIWQPKIVSSVQMSPNSNHNNHQAYGTHVNLEATSKNEESSSIGVKHNISPLPFGQSPPAPGENVLTKVGEGRYRKISHSSYNSPMGLYNQKNRNQTFERTLSNATGNQHDGTAPQVSPTTPPSMYCGSCGGFIRGVFVKVQGRIPMHPECLKCCKCGIGLRNIGYFYIKEQLYCETHAKQAAPPPEPGMKAVVVYK